MQESHLSRTAGYTDHPTTIQAWKKNIASSREAGHSAQGKSARGKIVHNLQKAGESRTASFDLSGTKAMGFRGHDTAGSVKDRSYQFDDVVDVINPLHHLPVIGFVYRGLTGDGIHPVSQIIGGGLFGGPIGAATGTLNAVSQIQTGQDLGDHAMSMVTGGNDAVVRSAFRPAPHHQADLVNHYKAPMEKVDLDALPEKEPVTRLNLSI